MPARHGLHAAAPVAFIHRPAGQSLHTVDAVAFAAVPYLPTPHPVQSSTLVPAVPERYVPWGQPVHCVDPVVSA